jgi:hypothetical protein
MYGGRDKNLELHIWQNEVHTYNIWVDGLKTTSRKAGGKDNYEYMIVEMSVGIYTFEALKINIK